MKRYIWMTLSIFLLCSLLSACNTQTASSVPTQSTTPTPSQVFEFKFASFMGPDDPASRLARDWAAELAKRTEGRVIVKFYYSESLVKFTEVLSAIKAGVIDMGAYGIGQADPGLQPLSSLVRYPFMNWGSNTNGPIESMRKMVTVYEQLYNEFPEIQAEWKDVVFLWYNPYPPYQFHFTRKNVRLPQDIKGMKIIAQTEWAEAIKALGATPLAIGAGDYYMSLERGLAEGMAMHYAAVGGMGLSELLPYHLHFGESGCMSGMGIYIMSASAFDSLLPPDQKVIKDLISWATERQYAINAELHNKYLKACEDKGDKFTYLTPEEILLWQEAAQPVYDKFIGDNTANNGKAVLDEARRLIKETKK
jgi:TRAP-type transport system periplasmic protein